MEKFKNSYVRLIILMIISTVAGLSLIIIPEKIHPLVIMFVGISWVIDGLFYMLEIYYKIQKEKHGKIFK